MKIFVFILLVCAGLFCSSCGPATKVVEIETLEPAEYPVAYAGKTVAIFNALHVHGGQTEPHVYASDSLKTGLVAQGLQQGLTASELFEDYDIPVYNLDLFCDDNSCPDLQDTAYLHSLSEQAQADLLIIVDSVGMVADQTVERRFNSNYGNYYRGLITLPYKIHFRIYDVAAQSYLPVFRLNDTLHWDSVAQTSDEALRDLPDMAAIDTLAPVELGYLFAKTTVPQWKPERRFYFIAFGKQWGQATAYAGTQDWKQAVRVWGEIVRQSAGKNAAYAAFNLALGSEMTGEYLLALEWLQMADNYYVLSETEGYRQRLRQRLTERKTVEQQLE